MGTLLLVIAALLAALAVERVRLDRARAAVPLRIAVTGTRGKTTLVRLLASVLRRDGRTVLAKTTGSEPTLVLPDGSVHPIRRRGPASIVEQKALLHRAAKLGADAVVAEMMSIHAENHAVEGGRILLPHLVLATNFHVDHVEAQGTTPEDVGAVLGAGVPTGATVLVPARAAPDSFRDAIGRAGGTLVEVPASQSRHGTISPSCAFPEILDLVAAAARQLGVGDDAIEQGIASAGMDVGALRVWRAPSRPAYLVNAFAANDPASTARVLELVTRWLSGAGEPGPGAPGPRVPLRCVGILSLRADRGDRTLQWADALGAGFLDRFDALLVTGAHARALERRVRRGRALHGGGGGCVRITGSASPAQLTEEALTALGPAGGMVFGFGNIGGAGLALVEHWSRTGEAVAHGR